MGEVRVLKNRMVALWPVLCAQLSLYFLITWAPTFIDERFHVDVTRSTMLKVLPLFMGGVGALVSGLISAPMTRWTDSSQDSAHLGLRRL